MLDGIIAVFLLLALLQNTAPVAAVAALLVCMARGSVGRLTRKVWIRKVELAIAACLVYWLANYFWSGGSLENLLSRDFLRNDGALLITYPAFFCFLGWRQTPTYSRALWIVILTALSLMAIAGSLLILNAPYSYYFEPLKLVGVEEMGGTQRLFYGWYHAHNTAGGAYAIGCLIALAMLMEGKESPRVRRYTWVMFLCCVAGLAATFSRSGYLAFVAGSLFLLPVRQFKKALKFALLAVAPALLLVLTSSAVSERIGTITDPYYGTNVDRLELWRWAWEGFTDSPLVGIGFGRFNDGLLQFEGVKHFVYVAVRGETINNDAHAHNSYLHFLAEGGILGLLSVLAIWWFSWKELSFFELNLPKSQFRVFLRAARASVPAVFTMSMTEHGLGRGSVVLIAMALIGTTLASLRAEWLAASKSRVRAARLNAPLSPARVGIMTTR
jgi:O-antigen ligase